MSKGMTKRERRYLRQKKAGYGFRVRRYKTEPYDCPPALTNRDEPFYNFAMLIPSKPKIIHNEMKPLEDCLKGKSSTEDFINECRQIRETEEADFEVIEPKQLPSNNKA